MTPASERLVWAVETLEVRAADRLLEVGCGQGVAVSLVCERLRSGSILAIDRSAAMIAQARRRNREHVAAGRAIILDAVSLEDADFGGARFDKVFAVNVDFLRKEPARSLETLRAVLRPRGALYLFHQPPLEAKVRPWADGTPRILEAHGFTVRDVRVKKLKPASVACVHAVPSSSSSKA
ncbi:class I SAM-dependent methyltransferase [Pyxidicoccus fallax]|uniref:Class I SAM-dependent methyltransferase n=1 Tax=Pyxidicoccus fallax TaxID=394095 RepID=A0A848LB83_9BACT|nr:class I SAM-dependent methyltransferase [Pyxidicoccus fallax]NMO15492.1 class I SAM-dependent methyltransferase [Pyxidicoccus fallax]NPC80334.1 class I SAM-dependent methyltransferase [Pyxidicoccus fallax]